MNVSVFDYPISNQAIATEFSTSHGMCKYLLRSDDLELKYIKTKFQSYLSCEWWIASEMDPRTTKYVVNVSG